MSMPPAKTAIVPPDSAASCAAASMPRARPGHDDEIGVAEAPRQHRRHLAAGDGGVARADDGDAGRGQMFRLAAHREQRRRRIGVAEPGRIERLAEADEACADACRRRQFALRLGDARDGDAPIGAAAPRQIRQRLDRRLRRAEMVDQAAKRAWTSTGSPRAAASSAPRARAQFSATSGTILASRKLSFVDLLAAICLVANAAKGVSALQLARDIGCNPKSAFVLAHKIREALAARDRDRHRCPARSRLMARISAATCALRTARKTGRTAA